MNAQSNPVVAKDATAPKATRKTNGTVSKPEAKEKEVAVKFTLIRGEGAIIKAMTEVQKSAKTLQEKLHQVMCSALAHVKQHGDTTILSKCQNMIEYGFHRRGVNRWVTTMSPLVWERDGYKVKEGIGKGWQDKIDMPTAIATRFWEMEANRRENEPFDLDKAIARLVTTVEKRLTDHNIKDEDSARIKLQVLKSISPTGAGQPHVEPPKVAEQKAA